MPVEANRLAYPVVAGLAGVALALLIVANGVSRYYEQSAPEMAARANPANAAALRALSEQALEDRKPDMARRYALKALNIGPHDGTIWRALGQAVEASGDPAGARRLFAQAGTLTHRDTALASIFFERAVAEGRWDEAATQADTLLRRAPSNKAGITFRVAVLAREPGMARALAKVLAGGPPWEQAFYKELTGSRTHVQGVRQLLAAMNEVAPAYRPEPLSRLLMAVFQGGEPQAARALWLARLPANARPSLAEVYDPTFRDADMGAPFGWTLNEPGASLGDGLKFTISGMDRKRIALQWLMLPPGRYRLETQARLLEGPPAAAAWRLGCAGAAPVRLALTGGPTSAAGEFDVRTDCTKQILTLQAEPGNLEPSVAVVDAVRITRIG